MSHMGSMLLIHIMLTTDSKLTLCFWLMLYLFNEHKLFEQWFVRPLEKSNFSLGTYEQ